MIQPLIQNYLILYSHIFSILLNVLHEK